MNTTTSHRTRDTAPDTLRIDRGQLVYVTARVLLPYLLAALAVGLLG